MHWPLSFASHFGFVHSTSLHLHWFVSAMQAAHTQDMVVSVVVVGVRVLKQIFVPKGIW